MRPENAGGCSADDGTPPSYLADEPASSFSSLVNGDNNEEGEVVVEEHDLAAMPYQTSVHPSLLSAPPHGPIWQTSTPLAAAAAAAAAAAVAAAAEEEAAEAELDTSDIVVGGSSQFAAQVADWEQVFMLEQQGEEVDGGGGVSQDLEGEEGAEAEEGGQSQSTPRASASQVVQGR